MEAKASSLSTGGHCNTEEEMSFRRALQKLMSVCRYEEGLGDQKAAEHALFIIVLLCPPSAGNVRALNSPVKVSANLYTGRLCSLRYGLNVSFSSILIFLEYSN